MNTRTLYKVLKAIPVYPDEMSKFKICKLAGVDSKEVNLLSLSSDTPLCEDNNRYCWLSQEDKDKIIKRIQRRLWSK